jgi:hypothetical protein
MISCRADLFKSLVTPTEFTVKFIDNEAENVLHYVRTKPMDTSPSMPTRYKYIDQSIERALIDQCGFHANGQVLEHDFATNENLNIVLGKIISVFSKIDRVKSVVGPKKEVHNIFFTVTVR